MAEKVERPRFLDNEAYRCLRSGDLEGFRRHRGEGPLDLSNTDLRGSNLRGVDLAQVALEGAYLRDADLRGQDLSAHDLTGCSLYQAKVSGVVFPDTLSADEIRLSLEFGTRLRTGK